ncbi:hypothetical protein AMTRI_Chr10g8410 [Amborella trichopoda]
MVYIKYMAANLGLSSWGCVFYNNLLFLLMAPIFWFITGEYVLAIQASKSSFWVRSWASFAVGLSCVFGLVISFFGFAVSMAISTTAFAVTDVVNNMFDPFGLICLLFTILEGVLYQQSITKAPLRSSPQGGGVKLSVGVAGNFLSID